ncbi:MAG: sugar phosphate isomerase/epimerase family protein [Sphingomonadales bacterium]
MSRLLSLATGNLPEFTPVEVVEAAAEAGWTACGIWYDPEKWTDQTTRDTRNAFERTGLVPFDIEVVWIRPGAADPNHERLLAAGGEIGVGNALMVSSDPDMDATKRRFEELCRIADRYGINACFEFLPITEVKSLPAGLDVVRSVGHPRGKILVDALHLARSGGHPDMLKGLPADLFTYAQICDAPAKLPDMEFNTILHEAVDGRLMPGEGELPVRELVEILPAGLPLVPEQRSKPLRDAYPNPAERARAILDATNRFLRSL